MLQIKLNVKNGLIFVVFYNGKLWTVFFVKPSTKTVYCYTVLDNLLECKRNSKPYGVIFTMMLDCTIRAVIIFRPDTI